MRTMHLTVKCELHVRRSAPLTQLARGVSVGNLRRVTPVPTTGETLPATGKTSQGDPQGFQRPDPMGKPLPPLQTRVFLFARLSRQRRSLEYSMDVVRKYGSQTRYRAIPVMNKATNEEANASMENVCTHLIASFSFLFVPRVRVRHCASSICFSAG